MPTTVKDLAAVLGRPASAAEASELLWRMTATERVAAMHRGELTARQLAEWSARRPDEVPRDARGEFLWIAATTPEYADRAPR